MNLTNGIKNFLYIETVENQKRTRLILTKQENNNLNYENLITSFIWKMRNLDKIAIALNININVVKI